MSKSILSESEAIKYVFTYSNSELETMLNVTYSTIGAWRHRHEQGILGHKATSTILQKLNFHKHSEATWKKSKAK